MCGRFWLYFRLTEAEDSKNSPEVEDFVKGFIHFQTKEPLRWLSEHKHQPRQLLPLSAGSYLNGIITPGLVLRITNYNRLAGRADSSSEHSSPSVYQADEKWGMQQFHQLNTDFFF